MCWMVFPGFVHSKIRKDFFSSLFSAPVISTKLFLHSFLEQLAQSWFYMTNFQTDGVGNSITYKYCWKDRFSLVVTDICMFSHTDLPATWATFLPCYCLLNTSHKYLIWAVLCLILFFVLQSVYDSFFFILFSSFFLNHAFFSFLTSFNFPHLCGNIQE